MKSTRILKMADGPAHQATLDLSIDRAGACMPLEPPRREPGRRKFVGVFNFDGDCDYRRLGMGARAEYARGRTAPALDEISKEHGIDIVDALKEDVFKMITNDKLRFA